MKKCLAMALLLPIWVVLFVLSCINEALSFCSIALFNWADGV